MKKIIQKFRFIYYNISVVSGKKLKKRFKTFVSLNIKL